MKMTKLDDKHGKEHDNEKIKELEKMLEKERSKLVTFRERNRNLQKEINEHKQQLLEHKENENRLKEEIKTNLKMRQKLSDQIEAEKREIRRKERKMKKEAEEKKTDGPATGTNLELRLLMKQIERENKILKTQTKPVVAYNNENKAFEYIGEPAPLKKEDDPCDTLEELLTEIKEWLKINNRLTVSTIFNSFDLNRDGVIEKPLFPMIFERLGIKLHEKEVDMLFNCLNKDDPDLAKYKPLVVEITTGPRQIEFIPECAVEIGQHIIDNDVSMDKLTSEIDKNIKNKATKRELLDGLDEIIKNLRRELSDRCFTQYTLKDDKDNMDVPKFVSDVKAATLALVARQMKKEVEEKGREYARDIRQNQAEETKGKSLDNEFSRLDKEHDGVLTYSQFDELMDSYGLDSIKKNVRMEFKNLLDIDRKSEITLSSIKFILDLPQAEGHSHFGLDMKPAKDLGLEKEDEEIEANARRALRRIYQNNNLLDKLGKQLSVYDQDKDGVMHRNILRQSIQDVTKDVHQDDVDYITQYADKRNKGYFNPDFFLENIVRVAQDEAKKDAILRRLSNVVKHKGIDLEKELMKHTKNNSGVIDTYDFMRAMRELRIGLDGNDMEELIRFASNGEKYIDVKNFCKMIEESSKFKPISVSDLKKKADKGGKRSEASERDTKRLNQKIQALTNQLLDARKELEQIEKNANDWKAIAEKNEKALNVLSDKLLDPKDKIKKMDGIKGEGVSARVLKQQLKQQERILDLNNQLEELAQKNEELEKFGKVEAKSQIAAQEVEAKSAHQKLQAIRSENISLQNQIDKIINATSQFEKNEEAEYARQMNTKNLEERIRELESNERELNEDVLKAEHQNLDMKFERENHNQKVQRLTDKINDLEDYIEIYTQLPPSMINKAQNKGDFDLEKELAKMPGKSKRSAAELEKVIEGLKRVINSQKAELEQLKKKESKFSKKDDKKSTNKTLKDEISNLEKELQVVAEKDREIMDLQIRSEKLTEANRALMHDVKNEQKRYEFLESKYKELLVKYNVTFKDLEKKQDSLFTMSTGANRATYQEYLNHKENLNKENSEKKHH
jgi:Ca2+-binding EF-hand superfamily protein